MRFSRQEYWSGLPCPSPGDLPDLGIEPVSPTLVDGFFTIVLSGKLLPGKPLRYIVFPVMASQKQLFLLGVGGGRS